jgi:hypothetical protein
MRVSFVPLMWVLAQSQGPAPGSAKVNHPEKDGASQAKQQPAVDQRGTEQSPLVVKVVPPPNAQIDTQHRTSERDEKSPADRWLLVFTGMLVVVGGTQAAFLYWQATQLRRAVVAADKSAVAARDTVSKMTDTAERQLRAYMVLEDGEIVHVSHPVQVPAANLIARNTGETPAHRVIVQAKIAVAEYPLSGELPPVTPAAHPALSVIGRNGIINIPLALGAPLTQGELALMRFGKVAIYVYGHVTYSDAFGHDRTTHFRLMHHPLSGRIGSDKTFIFCEQGNEAD